MDRFEESWKKKYTHRFFYLHSSMDRFEVFVVNIKNSIITIYIPVWIDLKMCLLTLIIQKLMNLHSSMDRFEEGSYFGYSIHNIFTFQYG